MCYTGSRISSCPTGIAFDIKSLMPAGEEGYLDRVFINCTSWTVIVIAKSKLTKPIISHAKLLHARLGHFVPFTMNVVMWTGLHTGIAATEQRISMQLSTGSCAICTQAKQIRPTVYAQDQTWMDDHGASFSVVTTDMNGPIMDASCIGRFLLQFTCTSMKWSWYKVIEKKTNIVGIFIWKLGELHETCCDVGADWLLIYLFARIICQVLPWPWNPCFAIWLKKLNGQPERYFGTDMHMMRALLTA